MKKMLHSLLCYALIVGSTLNGAAYAVDIVVDTENGLNINGETTYDNVTIESTGSANITNGGILSSGILTNNNSITNNGSIITTTIINNAASSIIGDSGAINITGGGTNAGSITQNIVSVTGGTFYNTNSISSESFNSEAGVTINNSGNILSNVTNNGTINNAGSIGLEGSTVSITNNGTLYNAGNANIYGDSVINNAGAAIINESDLTANTINNSGLINNSSSIDVAGAIINNAGGNLNNAANSTIEAGSIENGGIVYNEGTIGASNSVSITNSGTISNASGGTINGSLVTNNSGATITNEGTFNSDTISNFGNINNSSSIDITGSIINNAGGNLNNVANSTIEAGSIENGGIVYNEGTIGASNKVSITNSGTISNASRGTINGSFVTNNSGATITNDGTFNSDTISNSGNINNSSSINIIGSIINNAGGNLNNAANSTIEAGSIENGGIVYNEGTIGASNSVSIINSGTISNASSGTINGSLVTNNSGATITNDGTFNSDTINNSGTFNNNQDLSVINPINNYGILNNGGTVVTSGLNNTGTTYNAGTINNSGAVTNSGIVSNATNASISGTDWINNSGASIINNGSISGSSLANSGEINNNSSLSITGIIDNNGSLNSSGSIVANTMYNNGTLYNTGMIGSDTAKVQTITNSGVFANEGMNAVVYAGGVYNNSDGGEIRNSGTYNADSLSNSGSINNSGSFVVNDNFENNSTGVVINSGSFIAGSGSEMTNNGSFLNSGANAQMSAESVINNKIFGAIDGANVELKDLKNNDTVQISNSSSLSITSMTTDLAGKIDVVGGENNLSLEGASQNIAGTLNVGNSIENTILNINNGNIIKDAVINITDNGRLEINNDVAAIFNENDIHAGDLALNSGTITFDNFSTETSMESSLQNGSGAFYEQHGGTLNLINNSSLKLGAAHLADAGTLNIDSTSKFLTNSEVLGGSSFDNVNTSGLFGAMNSDIDDYYMTNLNIGQNSVGTTDNQADFTIDVYARSNAEDEHAMDRFVGTNLTGEGTVNISDWSLGKDIFGWDAPIDRDIALDNIFKFDNISQTVNLTATKKEVFTPIGWYQLNNHGGINGNYTLNLTRFNPQVYRGQVTTLAQWMNQLAIDDMLFNHSMVLPSFKDEDGGVAYSGIMTNRYAAIDPQFAPYQYSRKDGGLWYKMYGTFETLQMSQGLSNVGNNAYGALIGADFGLKELKRGWKFMPTAYIGYNGAHQYYSGLGAYQNGGQAGFLGTWYKNNFIIGGLVYGGVYQNSMDIAGHTDNTFNYFAGAATKAAYNWRFHRDWVLQPNLFLAYNFFGQQNWHSDFGQMGMMSGILNGINLAPGLNLIWEKETFSIYATLQYMYNLNGAVGGRAGNVGLPHLYMDRGYIQYGIGFTKRFTDRFSGYFQTVFRNVGRTGVGFQLGFNWLIGR